MPGEFEWAAFNNFPNSCKKSGAIFDYSGRNHVTVPLLGPAC